MPGSLFLFQPTLPTNTQTDWNERLSSLHLSLVVVHGIHGHHSLGRDDKHGHVEAVIREAVDAGCHLLAGGEPLLGQAELALLPLLSAGVGEDAEAEGENQ